MSHDSTRLHWAGAALTDDVSAVDRLLSDFLAGKEQGPGPQVSAFVRLLREFLVGGKRLRPLLCCCGWRAAGGYGDTAAVRHVAASLELFHSFALIHDDVMDASDTRRGRPTMHRLVAARHRGHQAADLLGVNVAILLGDLALGWSYDLVHAAALDSTQAATVWPLLDAMRIETMTGQYLDLLATGTSPGSVEDALAIVRYKTAKYTVEYPLRLGAHLAGAGDDVLGACTAYGIPLGEAFQLRDDLLGVFGNPAETGKPALDDLRFGKHTVLLAIARQRADAHQRNWLDALVGDPELDEDSAAEVRYLLTAIGARATVEHMITDRCNQALAILNTAPFQPVAVRLLRYLTTSVTRRNR